MIRFLWELLGRDKWIYVFLIQKDLSWELKHAKKVPFEKAAQSLCHFVGEKKLVEELGNRKLSELEFSVSEIVLCQKVRWSEEDYRSYKEDFYGD